MGEHVPAITPIGVPAALPDVEKVRIEDVEGRPGPAAVSRPLTGAGDLALNYYELAPGEDFAYGYHRHGRQEFIVQQGTVTFETESGDVVEAGEVVRFAPGEFQRGVTGSEKRVNAFALGAPHGVTWRFDGSVRSVGAGPDTRSSERTTGALSGL